MKCRSKKCANGYEVCCQWCEFSVLCQERCRSRAGCQHMGDKAGKSGLSQDQRFYLPIIGMSVLTLIMIAFFVFVICNQNNIYKAQTDTLNQIMELRQEIEAEPVTEATILDPADKLLIAKVAMAESSAYEGMVAVVQTVKDRSDLWNIDPYSIVTAKSQYAPPINGMVSEEAMQAVTDVFENGARAFKDPVTHFHAAGTIAYWTENKVSRGVVGGNEFWY